MASSSTKYARVGIDIGGTFTDFVIFFPETGKFETFKLLSSPVNPAYTVLEGIEEIKNRYTRIDLDIVHGSTVATNALLERKGAKTALITTKGFRDILQIGRQNRPELYDLLSPSPPPLIPENLCMEIDERVDYQGNVLIEMDISKLDDITQLLIDNGVVSVAVCLLFSFLYPDHENAIATQLRSNGFFVSPSNEILPEYREYERMSTTVINAYVSPILDRYLVHLMENVFSGGSNRNYRLRMMQSNGGNMSLEDARRNGVRCILSGPAGGIVGANYITKHAIQLLKNITDTDDLGIITFDMGGTSTDVALISGLPKVTTESVIGGFPIQIPVLDIHTIGAGGGSIAHVDYGGALRVGPESAAADPGPACYGRGNFPTVTDANFVLGRLAKEFFLGGKIPLDYSRSRKVMARLGDKLGLDIVETSLGVIEIANAHMERALRVISIERGFDPTLFTLVSFGGAGGLHAVELAKRLGIPNILIPPIASTLSAFGMLATDVVRDYSQTVMLPGDVHIDDIITFFNPMIERGYQEMIEEIVSPEDITIEQSIDIRYRGQSYELTIPFSSNFINEFHTAHKKTYGYDLPDEPFEIVNLRARAIGKQLYPNIKKLPITDSSVSTALINNREVFLANKRAIIPFYDSDLLHPGMEFDGPGIVIRSDTTVYLEDNCHCQVDIFGNLVITY